MGHTAHFFPASPNHQNTCWTVAICFPQRLHGYSYCASILPLRDASSTVLNPFLLLLLHNSI
jgi:hypothetical protein